MLADALGIGHTKLDTGLLSMLHLVFVCSTSTIKKVREIAENIMYSFYNRDRKIAKTAHTAC